jgi:hypothetical protein
MQLVSLTAAGLTLPFQMCLDCFGSGSDGGNGLFQLVGGHAEFLRPILPFISFVHIDSIAVGDPVLLLSSLIIVLQFGKMLGFLSSQRLGGRLVPPKPVRSRAVR